MPTHTMTLDELAEEMGRRPSTMRRVWPRLHRQHGFPRPLPGGRLIWSRDLVRAWIRSAALPAAPANDDGRAADADAAAVIESYRRELRAGI